GNLRIFLHEDGALYPVLLDHLASFLDISHGHNHRKGAVAVSIDRQAGEVRCHFGAESATRIKEDKLNLPAAVLRKRPSPPGQVWHLDLGSARAEGQPPWPYRRSSRSGKGELSFHRLESQKNPSVLQSKLISEPYRDKHQVCQNNCQRNREHEI